MRLIRKAVSFLLIPSFFTCGVLLDSEMVAKTLGLYNGKTQQYPSPFLLKRQNKGWIRQVRHRPISSQNSRPKLWRLGLLLMGFPLINLVKPLVVASLAVHMGLNLSNKADSTIYQLSDRLVDILDTPHIRCLLSVLNLPGHFPPSDEQRCFTRNFDINCSIGDLPTSSMGRHYEGFDLLKPNQRDTCCAWIDTMDGGYSWWFTRSGEPLVMSISGSEYEATWNVDGWSAREDWVETRPPFVDQPSNDIHFIPLGR